MIITRGFGTGSGGGVTVTPITDVLVAVTNEAIMAVVGSGTLNADITAGEMTATLGDGTIDTGIVDGQEAKIEC